MKILDALMVFVEEIVPSVMIFVMTAVVCYGVTSRYYFGQPIAFMNELVVLLAIWIVFLGSAGAANRRLHIGMEYVIYKLPKGRVQAGADAFLSLAALVTLAYVTLLGWRFAMRTGLQLQVLGISKMWMWLGLPVGMALMSIRFVERSVHAIRGLVTGDFTMDRTSLEGLAELSEEFDSGDEVRPVSTL